MRADIRAMTFAEILDQSFSQLRSNFVLLVGIAAVFNVPSAIIQSEFMQPVAGELPGTTFWTGWSAVMLIAFIGMPWSQLAITWSISETALGRSATFSGAYEATFSRYPAYIGTVLLAGLGVVLGMFLLVLPGFYLMVLWLLLGPVVVIEGIAGPRALGRSRELIKGNWWRSFGIFMLAAILAALVSGGFQYVFAFVPFVGGILNGLVASVAFAFSSLVLVSLYFDLRCRHEDFDLQLLAEQVGGETNITEPG